MTSASNSKIGGGKDSEADWKPRLGMEFSSIEDVRKFWVNFARRIGFGDRKHWFDKSKREADVTSCRFVCCREGLRREDRRSDVTTNPLLETRTNCPVRIGVTHIRGTGKFRVHDFVAEHNHVLYAAETNDMLGC